VVGFYDDDAVRTPDGGRLTKVKLSRPYHAHAHLFDIALAAVAGTGVAT
jgi:hypothetical protein